MPKGKNQKFKLYRLAQIMLENTDEEHYITMPEIKEKLEEYEVTADRKSLYNDLIWKVYSRNLQHFQVGESFCLNYI